ncbi:F0F1 ATP synthase subunit A [Spiroplasma clarkii]|nr:FoF1 ATP synthase subunit a [Spiroplasma clarkii]ARU90955.1 F0F1 ATP synthase subunit A [Spiroplasma clarkii]
MVLAATMVQSFENMVVGVMGKKFKHLTPYVMYLFLYILVSSIIALLGFEPLTSSLTVTLAMAIVTFVAIYYYGLRYQKFLFFQRYMYNPIDIFTQFVPILSLSFRLFGNIVAGSIILGLFYAVLINLQGKIFGVSNAYQDQLWWAGFNFFSTALLPWLHLYFDLFDGFIQGLVFSMLTLSYWANAKNGEHERSSEPVERYNTKKLRVRKIKIHKHKNEEKTEI